MIRSLLSRAIFPKQVYILKQQDDSKDTETTTRARKDVEKKSEKSPHSIASDVENASIRESSDKRVKKSTAFVVYDWPRHVRFVEKCREIGSSACQQYNVYEEGFLATDGKPFGDLHVHVHQTPIMQRPRRLKHAYRGANNFYDKSVGDWFHREGEPLNGNGHVQGCGCAKCLRIGNYAYLNREA